MRHRPAGFEAVHARRRYTILQTSPIQLRVRNKPLLSTVVDIPSEGVYFPRM